MNVYTMTSKERVAEVDRLIAQIKAKQDEYIRGGREITETPEQTEKRKYKRIRLSRIYDDGNDY